VNIEQVLKEQLMELRAGTVDVKRANAVCNTAGKYLGFVRVKMDLMKMAGAKPNAKFLADLTGNLKRK
jgi:hypothetical protein